MPKLTDIQYVKACECQRTTASGPRTYLRVAQQESGGYTQRVGWSPGPICDQCDTPWKRPTEE